MCKILEVFTREVVEYHKQGVMAHSSLILDDSRAESNVDSVDLVQEVSDSNKDSVSNWAVPLHYILTTNKQTKTLILPMPL